MDKPAPFKKNLRAHRRTASSNLQDFNFKQDPSPPIPPPKLKNTETKEKDTYFIGEGDYLKIPFIKQEEHEVAKLVRASSEQTLEKKVIVDSLFQGQEQKVNSLNLSSEMRIPLHSPKLVHVKEPQQSQYLGVDGRSFKKKQRPNKSNQVNKDTKKKLVSFKKVALNRMIESEYFVLPETTKLRKDNKIELPFKLQN